jgi:hypothetical protein
MPRKPFVQVAKPGTSYAIGPGQINSRPELASLVGQCIAMWADIELQMGLSLGAILKTNSEAAVALFLAAKTSRAQRDSLAAVARLLLTGDDLDAFEALMTIYVSLEKQRNALAHGLFGISDALPDALLWCDMQNHANYLINAYLAVYQGKPLADPNAKLREYMFVYTRRDLEELLRDLTELQKAAFHFHCHHQPRENKPQDHFKEMVELPAMCSALRMVRNSRALP